jgi:hypothetical protein
MKMIVIRGRDGDGAEMERIRIDEGADGRRSGAGAAGIRHRDLVKDVLERYRQCFDVAKHSASLSTHLPTIIREDRNALNSTNLQMTMLSSPNSYGSVAYHNSHSSLNIAKLANMSENSFEYAHKTYLPNVGWCLASPSEQFLMLFSDGNTVLIDGRKNLVAFRTADGITGNWLTIDQTLPFEVKQKLTFFPSFVDLLKSGQSHSFVA